MPHESGKPEIGRQPHLPFNRAFMISMNSLKIRFWRSTITAGGIFLGIAFLGTILTQQIMHWPLPEKVDPGYVRIAGQVVNPYDFETWRPVPAAEGLKAGIPKAVIDRVARGKDTFSLTEVVQGMFQAGRADKNRARVMNEWRSLKKLRPIQVYVDAKNDKDIKVSDAIKAGVPRKIAEKLARGRTFKGSALVAVLKNKPAWVKPIYYLTALDLEIFAGDAREAGVPDEIFRQLAGDNNSFKGSALNEAIQVNQPKWMKIWAARVKRYAVFKTVPKTANDKLDHKYAASLRDVFSEAKTPINSGVQAVVRDSQGRKIDSDLSGIMIVNANGRRESVNLQADPAKADKVKVGENDYILVPDRNSKYRMIWLVVMSLLVCTVGISNSMLMAVTERFKEIGTMKCLGATDSFVRTLFILESSLLGIVASILGWAVGFVLMVLLAGVTRGWDIVGTLSAGDVGLMFVKAVGVGLVVTIVATIAPAQRAARMPAAMALRTEI